MITIKPDPSGTGPKKGDGETENDGNVGIDPGADNGVGKNADINQYPDEAPPPGNVGCAIVLAHEIGHALGHEDEGDDNGNLTGGDNVETNENPVRACFGEPDRTSYHGVVFK